MGNGNSIFYYVDPIISYLSRQAEEHTDLGRVKCSRGRFIQSRKPRDKDKHKNSQLACCP